MPSVILVEIRGREPILPREEPAVNRRVVPALVAAALALAAALAPADEAAAPASASVPQDGRLFFSMQIADERGEVLAEPKLLGVCGVPVEMTLTAPGNLEVPRLSLRLEPALEKDGFYEIAYELAIPALDAHGRGTVRVRPGEEKSARLEYPGGHLEMQLAAFAVPSDAFRLYLEHGIAREAPPLRT
jgi:hypothetical protein